MDSEGENAEGQNSYAWVEKGTAVKGETVSKDSIEILNDTKNSAVGSSDENFISGDVSVTAKGTSSKEFVTSSVNNVEGVSETGASASVKLSGCPILDAEVGDNSRSCPIQFVGSNEENYNREHEEHLPSVNVPEKIIFCFDLSEDQFYLSTKYDDVNDVSTLTIIKQAIEMFIHSKHMIDKRHEFALVIVHKKAVWLQDFTNKPKDILPVLSELTETPPSDSYCLSSLFDVIKENVTLPVVENILIVPPPFVIRPIIIYSRCQCIPKFSDGQDSFHALMSSKYFGFDYIILHESLSPESDKIASVFSDMCIKPWSLEFHVSRSATKVLDSMAKLLSHPLQRDKISERKDMGEKYSIADSNGLEG